MIFKLHDRRNGRRDQSVRGLSCDEAGLHFAGDCALVENTSKTGGRFYRPRPMAQINQALSAGYGAEIDLSPRARVLDRIAEHLTKGDIAQAQLLALQLRLPDLAGDEDVERLRKTDQLLRFNSNHDDQGRFASAPGDGAAAQDKTPAGRLLAQDRPTVPIAPTPQVQAAATRALQAQGAAPIQGEYLDASRNALNYWANGKPIPAGLPTPDVSRYLNGNPDAGAIKPADLFAAPVTLEPGDLQLAATLDSHLSGTPMAKMGERLVYWGKKYNIDPRLLAALAGLETSFGAKVTMGSNNFWNWEFNREHPSRSAFDSPDSAIHSVANGLDTHADLENLGFYDKTANSLGPKAWYYCWNGCASAAALASILRKLGGNPARLGYGGTYRPYLPKGKAGE